MMSLDDLIPAVPHGFGAWEAFLAVALIAVLKLFRARVLKHRSVYVDRFGSLVTNLTPELVPPYARIEIEDVDAGPLRRTFGDVATGGLVCYVGSGGEVEIAVRDGSAARRLGIGVGGRVRARLG